MNKLIMTIAIVVLPQLAIGKEKKADFESSILGLIPSSRPPQCLAALLAATHPGFHG
jgi:hypothetical protein